MKFLIYSLAVWRLSRFLVKEEGPGRICVKIRELSGIQHDKDGEILSYNDYTPLFCVWCTSVYAAALLLFAPDWACRLLASSGLAGFIEEITEIVQPKA